MCLGARESGPPCQGSHQLMVWVRTHVLSPLNRFLTRGHRLLPSVFFSSWMWPVGHNLVLLLDGEEGVRRAELVREEPCLATAVVCAVRDVEASGSRVQSVLQPQAGAAAAADLVLRLRRISPGLSEEEMAVLLEMLPL